MIRFAELYNQVKFPEALALLRQWCGMEHSLLHEAERLYRSATPSQRGVCLSVPTWNRFLVDDRSLMRIGYAPGGGDRSVDKRKHVSGRGENRRHAENCDEKRHHYEGVGTAKGKSTIHISRFAAT